LSTISDIMYRATLPSFEPRSDSDWSVFEYATDISYTELAIWEFLSPNTT